MKLDRHLGDMLVLYRIGQRTFVAASHLANVFQSLNDKVSEPKPSVVLVRDDVFDMADDAAVANEFALDEDSPGSNDALLLGVFDDNCKVLVIVGLEI